jgi:hypothetical protein
MIGGPRFLFVAFHHAKRPRQWPALPRKLLRKVVARLLGREPRTRRAAYHGTMWATVEGIVVTLGDLIAAVSGWLVAKLRGKDLFDQVARQGQPGQASHDLRKVMIDTQIASIRTRSSV